MRKAIVVFGLLACCGCQRSASTSGAGGTSSQPASTTVSTLTNRVWARTDSTGLPGVMRIFLSDGTLVMDSCWETYQLAQWQMTDSTVSWSEGGARVAATVIHVGANEMILRVHLAHGLENQHYRLASVPYICPDMRR